MYISPIDILDISLEDLEQIDKKNIIRLEKRLKVLRLQNQDNSYNIDNVTLLLNQLKNEKDRNFITFIEKHPLFKTFITSGKADNIDTFKFQEEYSNKLQDFSDFLHPYLKTYFIPLLKKKYRNKSFEIITTALKNNNLFNDEILLESHQFIEQQTKILTEKISVCPPRKLFEKHPEVTYESYIDLLNTIPPGIIEEVKLEYAQELVDYFRKSNIFNSEYPKIKNAYKLLAKIDVSSPLKGEVLENYSELGKGRFYVFLVMPEEIFHNKKDKTLFKVLFFISRITLTILSFLVYLIIQIVILIPLAILSFSLLSIGLVFATDEKDRNEAKVHLKEFIKDFKDNYSSVSSFFKKNKSFH
ncbi:hypothetical protein [uncultured Tenacibaculum sp.]|uniref:hypothetical protein n=1 Tax=uncultured Tenacibaculum sp. TaxID=174713 RepID=UPI0026247FCE|nr:hypothetical protein [uncultured Tenacibaculum sp.]